MSYLGWCYTRPQDGSASAPQYSGARARSVLSAVYNDLIYRDIEVGYHTLTVESREVVEVAYIHCETDTYQRPVYGMLLLLCPAQSSRESRQAALQRLERLIFTERVDPPSLPKSAQSYEAALLKQRAREERGPLKSDMGWTILLGAVVALGGLGWFYWRAPPLSSPTVVSEGNSAPNSAPNASPTISSNTPPHTPLNIALNGSVGALDPLKRGRSDLPSQPQASSKTSPETSSKTRPETSPEPTGRDAQPDAIRSARPLMSAPKVHTIQTLRDCSSTYEREVDSWSRWVRASLERRCQRIATRKLRLTRASLSEPSMRETPEQISAILARCRETAAELARLSPHLKALQSADLKRLCEP